MLTNVNSNIFKNSESINLLPVVSAEWNQNLFTSPYITVAGTGTNISSSLTSGTIGNVTSGGKPNFTTKSFGMSSGTGSVQYTMSTGTSPAYKVITYVKTNSPTPIMVRGSGKGTGAQYGSEQVEADSLGWTKIVTYIGSSGPSDTITSFVYSLVANAISGTDVNPTVFFTVPEIYATTYFDYQNHSLFPTEMPFTYFRPGESYVGTGNSQCAFPASYRKINSQVISGYSTPTYSPVSAIIQNPQFFLSAPPVPVLKNALPTDVSPYRYFVSDASSKSITGIYEKAITTNKLVLKFNTLMTIPSVNIAINGSNITVDGSQTIIPPNNADGKCTGVLTLYWTGTAWTKTPWTTMPSFNSAGALSISTTITKITVTQISKQTNTEFTSYSTDNVLEDLGRMHLIEVSPRLEIDLTDFVEDISISKSLDANNTALPLSSLNTNDATIVLSGIPAVSAGVIVPIFSSQSDQSSTILSSMLRKNVKFYINFNLQSYSGLTGGTVTSGSHIPGGVFYSDYWSENDIDSVTVQCYDVSRYLQSTPVPDYVANLKSVFEIITNILDLSGFTDYDYDSLYSICNNKSSPLDLSYYYCNSQDSTIIDALNKIFVAYQIGAHIDEYGIMKFLSLQNILSSTSYSLALSEDNIVKGGLSVSSSAKPGKISLRYQTPKIQQSPDVNNVERRDIKVSPSFIYTSSNDIVWTQQSMDSVGFNYINDDMSANDNSFNINKNDLLDIFHTFNMNNDGFAFIENEIVSFTYKEYTIKKTGEDPITVSVKNNLELSAEVNKFIKKYAVGLIVSDGSTSSDYDVLVEPTGNVTNVERGLFGTSPSDHIRISNLASKSLSEATITSSFNISSSTGNTSIVNSQVQDPKLPSLSKIKLKALTTDKTAVFPSSATDIGYQTYSVKFEFTEEDGAAAGLFFNMSSATSTAGAYFVELIRYNKTDPETGFLYSPTQYKYLVVIYDSSGEVYSWSDVSGECNSIVNNFSKIIKKTLVEGKYQYSYITDNAFNLKAVHNLSDGTDGENATVETNKRIVSVFINNVEVSGWLIPGQPYDPETNPSDTGWKATDVNLITGMRQKPSLPDTITTGTKFGFYATKEPVVITNLYPEITYPAVSSIYPAYLREIHATVKPLNERSVSYFYQDREFLNGLVQNQPLYNNSPTYIMQTTPEISGINYYDVQYTTPAAVQVDVWPIQYMMYYFPGIEPSDQIKYQKKLVNKYSLAYSTPLNTGFRARLAIANSSPHLVFLKRDADALVRSTVKFNLFTQEIIAPSDPEIIEKVLDQSNRSEVIQLDSEWIQSKQAAQKLLKIVETGLDGFSKNVSVNIFGNPLVQVGDIINLSYNLNGINQQSYLVHSVSHNFNNGLTTQLALKRIQNDLTLSAPVVPPTITSTTYNTVGRVGMTAQTVSSGTTDDGYYTISLPFPITFNGQSYSTIYVGTNSYVTFGSGSTVHTSLSSSNPALNKIMVSSTDATTVDGSVYGGVWYETSSTSWRIRYQGRKLSGTPNETAIVWELSSASTSPNVLNLQLGFTLPDGVTNVSSSTGTNWSTLGSDGTGWLITS